MKKNVLITGVSSGIGRALVASLIPQGYHVIGTVRKDEDLKALNDTYREGFSGLICDVTNQDHLKNLKVSLDDILGDEALFALINNAGIAIPGPLEMVDDQDFVKQMDVNLIAPRQITNIAIPHLNKYKSNLKPKVIFISSVSGKFAAPFNGPYCISKHALECMVDIYRRELTLYGIQVISILPGPIKTKIWSKVKGKFDKYYDSIYGDILKKADKIVSSTEKHALDVSKVTDRISLLLASNKSKTRYIIHKNARVFKLVSEWVPDKMLDRIILKNLKQSDPKKYRPV